MKSISQKFNQQGAVPVLALAIAAVAIIGVIFLINQKSNKETAKPQKQIQESSPSSQEQDWETYKDKERGYSISHPKGWTVKNLPSSEDRRLIRVNSADKMAFILIEAFGGSALENEAELEKVLTYLGDQLKKNDKLKNITLTKVPVKNDVGGYNASGEETYDNLTLNFEEIMKVGKNGRSIRIHMAYLPSTKDKNQPILAKIISSFKTD